MIGSLQSNKAKKAIELFDYIHSLDSEKLAKELDKRKTIKKIKLFYTSEFRIRGTKRWNRN